MIQAFRFVVDPNNHARSAMASHAGAARFAYNWGLALVKSRLAECQTIREAALCQGLSMPEADALAATVTVPWNLPALRREWNQAKDLVAPWWRENSKEAANTACTPWPAG